MLERFTDAARHAIATAGDLARDSGAEQVTPLHLLGGIAADEGPAGRALQDSGLTVGTVRSAAGPGADASPAQGRLGFSEEASAVIEGSLRLSRRRQSLRIDAADLLLALLARPDGEVVAALQAAGADPATILRALGPSDG